MVAELYTPDTPIYPCTPPDNNIDWDPGSYRRGVAVVQADAAEYVSFGLGLLWNREIIWNQTKSILKNIFKDSQVGVMAKTPPAHIRATEVRFLPPAVWRASLIL